MQPYELLEYLPTPGDKQLGIATIRCWGKIVLKYKICVGKDGHGFFPSEAGGIKTGVGADGKDTYDKIFIIESNYDEKQIKKFLQANINPYASNSSPFAQQGAQMTPPNQPYQYAQQTQPDPFKPHSPSLTTGGTFYANGQPITDGSFPTPRNPAMTTVDTNNIF